MRAKRTRHRASALRRGEGPRYPLTAGGAGVLDALGAIKAQVALIEQGIRQGYTARALDPMLCELGNMSGEVLLEVFDSVWTDPVPDY